MTAQQQQEMRRLEGRVVHLALADGSRYDEVSLVSAGRRTIWVFFNGEDAFVPASQVIDVWEAQSYRSAA